MIDRVSYFAETDTRNTRVRFGIKASDRTRHVYIIGKTGMGKSTLLENMAVQDIQNGEGMAFIDPHGKTAELLLEYVPKERIKDVIIFSPFDTEFPISFNVMEDVGYERRFLVVSGLMSAFKKIWVDAWSARMEYILSNTILALLEYPGSTLIGVNRMLSDKEYRKLVVDNIKDPAVKSFWVDEFAKYNERYMQEAGDAIKNKIGQFVSNPMIRNIIGQPTSSFDFRKIMDEKKIIVINLSKGRVGESNANLLGSMLITKIYLAAMSRADASPTLLKQLPNFYLYVDEFQSFANESFADILSEARKYKLNLTIAHQYIEQMSDEVRAAVFGNVGTMISFRVGSYDAEVLEKEFSPQFTANDLVNLGFVQIYLKLMINGVTSQPFSATTLPPIDKPLVNFREQIIDASRAQFAQTKQVVEEMIKEWHKPIAKPEKEFRGERGERVERTERNDRSERSERNNYSNDRGEYRKNDNQVKNQNYIPKPVPKESVQSKDVIQEHIPQNSVQIPQPSIQTSTQSSAQIIVQKNSQQNSVHNKNNNPRKNENNKKPVLGGNSTLRDALRDLYKDQSPPPADQDPMEEKIEQVESKKVEQLDDDRLALLSIAEKQTTHSNPEQKKAPIDVPEDRLRAVFTPQKTFEQ